MTIKNIFKNNRNKVKEIIAYLFFGLVATAINFLVFFISTKTFGWNYLYANILAWLITVLSAFVMNKFFVFKSSATQLCLIIKEAVAFFCLRVLSLILETAILYIMIDLLSTSESWSKVGSQFIVVITNYIFSKLFIFN